MYCITGFPSSFPFELLDLVWSDQLQLALSLMTQVMHTWSSLEEQSAAFQLACLDP
jgi:hypothetical protein